MCGLRCVSIGKLDVADWEQESDVIGLGSILGLL